MSLKIHCRRVGDVVILDLAGRLAEDGPAKLRDEIRDLLAIDRKKLLLNFAEVSYVNSMGIGELVNGFTVITNHGGQLKLLNLNKCVKDLLQITKLYTVFDVHEDEARAVRSFF